MEFYEIFSDLLQSKKITANRFATDIGISEGAVRAWRNGKLPSFDILSRTADYFDITIDELIGRIPPQHTEQETQLLRMFDELPDKEKANLLDYLEVKLLIVKKEQKLNSSSGKRSLSGKKRNE